MGKKKITKQRRISTKKKRWFNILAPKVFNKAIVGETPDVDGKGLTGRVVTISLGSIINNPRKHNIIVKLKLLETKGNDVESELVGYAMNAGQVKRFVRRNRNRVDDSFVCQTKDGIKIRFKPLLLTRGLATKQTLTDLRKGTQEFLTNYSKEKDYGDVVAGVLNMEPQKLMKESLRKVHPLAVSEIRAFTKQ